MKAFYYHSVILITFSNLLVVAGEYDPTKNRLRAEGILREIETYHNLPRNDLATSNNIDALGITYGLFPPHFIVLNRDIIHDENDVTRILAHEIGHVKDRSNVKYLEALAAYYSLTTTGPSFLLYGLTKVLPINPFFKALSYAVCTASGMAGALYFHKQANNLINRYLEKRADLIGLNYLIEQQKFGPICSQIAYLERAKILNCSHDVEHPTAEEEFEYTKKFLEKKNIHVTSNATKNPNDTLEGNISVTKNKQKLLGYTWQWKPKV